MKAVFEAPRTSAAKASLLTFDKKEERFKWNWHYHPELELTWIRQGRGTQLIGDHTGTYKPNNLVLLGSNLPHAWFTEPPYSRQKTPSKGVIVIFLPEMLPHAILSLSEFGSIAKLLQRAARGLLFPQATAKKIGPDLIHLTHCRRGSLHAWMEFIRILSFLAEAKGSRCLATGKYDRHRSTKQTSRLQFALAHIEEHYREEMPLAQLARHTGLSISGFSRFFRKMTGKTFVGYRNGCRIRAACRLLVETDLSVTELAYACGFQNLANFNRRFLAEKRVCPGNYRRIHTPPMDQA